MNWRDRYRSGSWRGVPFRTTDGTIEGGRRGETHEFPQADRPWREDLGGMGRTITISCWVAGPDYDRDADALVEACEAAGPGTLVYPAKGAMTVSLMTYRRRDSGVEGGIAEFELEFVETTGTPAAATPATDTAANAKDLAGKTKTAAAETLTRRFDVSKVTAFVEDAATLLVTGTATLAQVAAGPLGGSGAALRAFEAAVALLPADVRALVRAPADLAAATIDLFDTLAAIAPDPRRRAAAMRVMATSGGDAKPVIGGTAPRVRERDNQAAWHGFVSTLGAAALVDALADSDFASAADAAIARDDATRRIDALVARAGDAFDDDAMALLVPLRTAMIADLTMRGATLARTYALAPGRTEPALAIARRVTNDTADIAGAAEDLIARNRIRHPGFVLGGTSIDLLTEAQAA